MPLRRIYCSKSPPSSNNSNSGSVRSRPPSPVQRSSSVDTLDRDTGHTPPSPVGSFKRKHSFDVGDCCIIANSSMSHMPPSLDDRAYVPRYGPRSGSVAGITRSASSSDSTKRRRMMRTVGSSLALLGAAIVLFGDNNTNLAPFGGSGGGFFAGFGGHGRRSDERIVKRSLRALEDKVRNSRRILRDTVAWKRVPRMMLATDLAALGAGEKGEESITAEASAGDAAASTSTADSSAAATATAQQQQPAPTTSTAVTIKPIRKRRMAIVRPFGPGNAADLEESFRLWDTHWPCSSSRLTSSEHNDEFQIDLYLLFSRTFDPALHPAAVALAEELQNKFASNNGWNGCFARLFKFEADIIPGDDNYDKSVHSGFHKDGESLEHRDIMWVNGPNESFRKVMTVLGGLDGHTIDGILPKAGMEGGNGNAQVGREASAAATDTAANYWADFSKADIAGGGGGGNGDGAVALLPEVDGYELVSILEPDVRPRRAGWLDDMLDEIHNKEPFAMLGSKYKGHAWDNFKSELPSSLLNHLNGNAHYNLTHPLFLHLLSELNAEAGSHYNAIPYDYRISQMITEGRDGIPPEFPFPDMKDADTGGSIILAAKGDKFRRWWDLYGPSNDLTSPDGESPMKESDVVANFAATDYLDEHLPAGETEGVVVHGKGGWRGWVHEDHDITLVISDWDGQLLPTVIQSLNDVSHPYTEVIVMRPPPEERPSPSLFQRLVRLFGGNVDVKTVAGHLGPNTVNVKYVDRIHPDHMDLCSAPVRTNWFMVTNSYHALNPKGVDLMFTHPSSNAESSRPVISYTPARSRYCTDYEACREIFDTAKRFHEGNNFDKIVLDMDMLYHTRSRDGFCGAWGEINKEEQEQGGNDGQPFFPPLSPMSMRGPSATAYAAYLQRAGMADSIYKFSNQLLSGGKDAFSKVHREEEEDVRRRMAQEEDLLKIARMSGSAPLDTLMGTASPASSGVDSETRSLAAVEEKKQQDQRAARQDRPNPMNNNPKNNRRAQEEAVASLSSSASTAISPQATSIAEDERLFPEKNDGGPQCALVYEKAKQCGANGNVQDTCCDGLYCLGEQCTAPTECLGSSCINFRNRSLGGFVWSPPGWLVKS